ncbi:mucoidy inhibitor MuiA family protein [uncultured Desulfosarcina sp.]|uniref:mucoidy inhibitor MuiA family protein n=1 Tax=uncultured Desulfosarcina sp. TaxID=218289 RepID=UPI0029C6BDB4|nr:mucoidy inhibitor MuiA family protein [uncultured Desulfosarcina sp.]
MSISTTEVESTIRAVTIYQGWAMISRTATARLEAGKHLIVFTDLPESLDRDNIQVKGTGEATLGECIFETEFFVEEVDENKRQLQKKAQELEDRIAEIQLKMEACENEKAFVEKIASFVTAPLSAPAGEDAAARVVGGASLDVGAWGKMLAFYHDQNGAIRDQMLASQKAERDLKNELEKIYNELDSMGDGIERSRNIIKVSVTKEKAGEITLDLSYVITGPTWRPVYNLRASSDSDTISLEYDALVNQATGEAWKDVALKLSTARINVSGVIPTLHPWWLSFYRPSPPRSMAKRRGDFSEEEEMGQEVMKSAAPSNVAESAPPEMEMDFIGASVESGGTSVVFSVGGGGNINGDNTDTRVSILRREFPASSHYATVPKLSEFAYLTAKIENDSDFPLLPGKANIFFDDAFVSVSALSLVMPGQEMEVSLGVDEGVAIEHRFLKRFKKNQGLVSKRISEQFDYQIRITNNRKKNIEIDVFDQLPIAQDKEISVKTITPSFKDEKTGATLDDESKIKWQIALSAGEKRELPFSFVVEYPAGQLLSGL